MKWLDKLISELSIKIIVYLIVSGLIIFSNKMPIWIDRIGILWMTKINLLLFITVLLLCLHIYQEHKKYSRNINPNDYEFIERLGIWKHKKTGICQCPIDMSKKIFAPLQEKKHGWLCTVCRQFFENPDNPTPTPKIETTKPSRFRGFGDY